MLDGVCFSSNVLLGQFRNFPEVLLVDGTHGIDACRFSVHFIVIINGHGKGQIVFGAYLRREAG